MFEEMRKKIRDNKELTEEDKEREIERTYLMEDSFP